MYTRSSLTLQRRHSGPSLTFHLSMSRWSHASPFIFNLPLHNEWDVRSNEFIDIVYVQKCYCTPRLVFSFPQDYNTAHVWSSLDNLSCQSMPSTFFETGSPHHFLPLLQTFLYSHFFLLHSYGSTNTGNNCSSASRFVHVFQGSNWHHTYFIFETLIGQFP